MRQTEERSLAQCPGARVLILAAPYYRDVVEQMAQGAEAALAAAGATAGRLDVPGAFELPTAIAVLQDAVEAGRADWDGYVALGCVVRGETSHYDYVCGESARALMDLGVGRRLAIGYGILTVETLEQAAARADPAGRDKGGEAAAACLALIALKRALRGAPHGTAR